MEREYKGILVFERGRKTKEEILCYDRFCSNIEI
jgi:hypothetical protein